MLTPDNLPPARVRVRTRPVPPVARAAEPQPLRPAEAAPTSASKKPPYDVGYGKPPVHTRFQKGQSGNPKGRKKGSKNLDTLVRQLLDERIPVNTPTGRRNVPRIEMLLRKLIELGAKGNPRAIEQVLRQYALAQATAAAQEPASVQEGYESTEADVASLDLLREITIAEFLAEQGGAS